MPEHNEAIDSPVYILGSKYKNDLDNLESMKPVAITKYDINKLTDISNKYGIENEITKHNFYLVKGKLEKIILERLEKYAIKDVLGKAFEETPHKLPSEPVITRQKVPDSIKDKLKREGKDNE